MKLYYPVAEYYTTAKAPKIDTLITYDGSEDIESAKKCFFLWALQGYKIRKAWIEVYEGEDAVETIMYYKED